MYFSLCVYTSFFCSVVYICCVCCWCGQTKLRQKLMCFIECWNAKILTVVDTHHSCVLDRVFWHTDVAKSKLYLDCSATRSRWLWIRRSSAIVSHVMAAASVLFFKITSLSVALLICATVVNTQTHSLYCCRASWAKSGRVRLEYTVGLGITSLSHRSCCYHCDLCQVYADEWVSAIKAPSKALTDFFSKFVSFRISSFVTVYGSIGSAQWSQKVNLCRNVAVVVLVLVVVAATAAATDCHFYMWYITKQKKITKVPLSRQTNMSSMRFWAELSNR